MGETPQLLRGDKGYGPGLTVGCAKAHTLLAGTETHVGIQSDTLEWSDARPRTSVDHVVGSWDVTRHSHEPGRQKKKKKKKDRVKIQKIKVVLNQVRSSTSVYNKNQN